MNFLKLSCLSKTPSMTQTEIDDALVAKDICFTRKSTPAETNAFINQVLREIETALWREAALRNPEKPMFTLIVTLYAEDKKITDFACPINSSAYKVTRVHVRQIVDTQIEPLIRAAVTTEVLRAVCTHR